MAENAEAVKPGVGRNPLDPGPPLQSGAGPRRFCKNATYPGFPRRTQNTSNLFPHFVQPRITGIIRSSQHIRERRFTVGLILGLSQIIIQDRS